MDTVFSRPGQAEIVLYTDALIARGTVATRHQRISDILNLSEAPFLVLEDVHVTSLDGAGEPIHADVAQINLDAVLFAVVDTPVSTTPELRAPKTRHEALISVPPFRVTGTLHLAARSPNLRQALTDLTGRFLPVTDATFEAPSLGRAPQRAQMLAINHRRAQILAQYTESGDRPDESAASADPWAGPTGVPGPAPSAWWGRTAAAPHPSPVAPGPPLVAPQPPQPAPVVLEAAEAGAPDAVAHAPGAAGTGVPDAVAPDTEPGNEPGATAH